MYLIVRELKCVVRKVNQTVKDKCLLFVFQEGEFHLCYWIVLPEVLVHALEGFGVKFLVKF